MSNPFQSLPQLPPDVDEALEQFKLAIVRHRACSWDDISQDDMATVLASLTMFCLRDAPPLPTPSWEDHVKAVREAGGDAWDNLNVNQELAAMRGQPQGGCTSNGPYIRHPDFLWFQIDVYIPSVNLYKCSCGRMWLETQSLTDVEIPVIRNLVAYHEVPE